MKVCYAWKKNTYWLARPLSKIKNQTNGNFLAQFKMSLVKLLIFENTCVVYNAISVISTSLRKQSKTATPLGRSEYHRVVVLFGIYYNH